MDTVYSDSRMFTVGRILLLTNTLPADDFARMAVTFKLILLNRFLSILSATKCLNFKNNFTTFILTTGLKQILPVTFS